MIIYEIFGGAKTTPGKCLAKLRQPHDLIKHSIKSNKSKLAEFRDLYEDGMSLRQIQVNTGSSKTKIRKTLLAAGVVLRDFKKGQTPKSSRTAIARGGNTPFGYCYLENELVVEPREYKIVLEMVRLRRAGKSLRAICKYLNDQKLSTRFGKKWNHEVIKNIIQRHLEIKLKNQRK